MDMGFGKQLFLNPHFSSIEALHSVTNITKINKEINHFTSVNYAFS